MKRLNILMLIACYIFGFDVFAAQAQKQAMMEQILTPVYTRCTGFLEKHALGPQLLSSLQDTTKINLDAELVGCLKSVNPDADIVAKLAQIAHSYYELVSPFDLIKFNDSKKDIEGNYLAKTDKNHSKLVGTIALEICQEDQECKDNQYLKSILILASAFHDLERFSPKTRTPKIDCYDSDLRKFIMHPLKSIHLMDALFSTLELPEMAQQEFVDLLQDVWSVILYHDSGVKGVKIDGVELLPDMPSYLREVNPTKDNQYLVKALKIVAEADALAFWHSTVFDFVNNYTVKEKDLPERLAKSFDKLSVRSKEKVMGHMREKYAHEKASEQEQKVWTFFSKGLELLKK